MGLLDADRAVDDVPGHPFHGIHLAADRRDVSREEHRVDADVLVVEPVTQHPAEHVERFVGPLVEPGRLEGERAEARRHAG